MTTKRRVLVVAPHAEVAHTVVGWLTSQGHEASLVKDFVSARSEFDAHPPDLLVTEVKLGEFNGLQLAIRAHVHSPMIPTIVIGDDDIVLERDALAQQARYVKTPELSRVFSQTASAVLDPSLEDWQKSKRRADLRRSYFKVDHDEKLWTCLTHHVDDAGRDVRDQRVLSLTRK